MSYETTLHNMRPTADHIDGLIELCAKHVRPGMVVAEIGSFAGTSSRIFCEALAGNGRLFCIDGWDLTWAGARNDAIRAERQFDEFAAVNREIVRKLKMTSEQAARTSFPVGSLDMVYIDAEHTYESVRKDIELWLPKVTGGVIAGHDYSEWYPGVIQAVNERFQNVETFADYSWAVKL